MDTGGQPAGRLLLLLTLLLLLLLLGTGLFMFSSREAWRVRWVLDSQAARPSMGWVPILGRPWL